MGLSSEEKAFDENDMIFDKSCVCPVCDAKFTYRAVKSNRARLIGTDNDLRPRYKDFDPLKYDVISCPNCSYSTITKFWGPVPKAHAEKIIKNLKGRVSGVKNSGVLSYDDALMRYQLALASAITKEGKASEKAYTCLKLAWILRGKKETYPLDALDYDEVIEICSIDEEEALKRAMEDFIMARQSERFPIAGMDENTLDYLLAEIAYEQGSIEISAKLVSQLLVKNSVNSRMKDKCRDLKERIKEQLKNK